LPGITTQRPRRLVPGRVISTDPPNLLIETVHDHPPKDVVKSSDGPFCSIPVASA
jgi:hypothetical protein